MPKKLSDEDVLAAIDREEQIAYGYMQGNLSKDRAKAMDYYLGKPMGNEIPDRSQVVLTDVADTIEWIMPSILRVFTSGDKVVAFDAVGPEDEQGADQETDYVNHVITQKNNWFTTCYVWSKDALLQKNGYVKAVWEQREDVVKEKYQGLTDDEFALLLQDEEVKPEEHTSRVEQILTPEGPIAEMLHDVVVQRTNKYGEVKIYNLPPEEVLVSTNTQGVSTRESPFIQHRPLKTISEIRALGYELEDDVASQDESPFSSEKIARQILGEVDDNDYSTDPSSRRVMLKETYIRVDQDGDGIAELRRIISVGKKVLENEEWNTVPICAISPILLPHQHFGLSIADLIADLQAIRSTVLRQFLDNMYFANNGRFAISDKVNLEDMLISRPGGVVRITDGSPAEGHIIPLSAPPFGAQAFSLLEYLDAEKETRTGITKYNQGLDANSLNKTATGISQIMGAAQSRVELVARTFAETGIKELFLLVHELVQKHEHKPQMVKLRNQWVTVDPRQWRKRTDMTVTVGLGTGNRDQMVGHLTNIIQAQLQALQIGVATPKNLYNSLSKLAENSGFKMPEEFFTNPEMQQPQPPPPDPKMIEVQSKMQLEQQKAVADYQLEQQKTAQQVQLEQEKMQLEAMKAKAEIELEREKATAEALLQQQKLEAELGLKLSVEQSKAELAAMQAHVKAVQDINKAEVDKRFDDLRNNIEQVAQSMSMSLDAVMERVNRPKKVIRGADGRIAGVE